MPAAPSVDRSEPLTWDVSPTDYRATALVRYVPLVFVGTQAGILLVAGTAALPALVSNPAILALVVVLTLVGGPMSLLYLWPMIRDPDQRPPLDPGGWYQDLSLRGFLLAVASCTVLAVGMAILFGLSAVTRGLLFPAYLIAFFAVPLLALSLVDNEGRLDPEEGTLTVEERTIDVTRLDRVRCWTVGSLTVVALGYVAGAGRPKPRLFVVPATDAAALIETLRAGATADADVEPGDSDRIARAVLAALGSVSLLVAVGGLVVPDIGTQASLALAYVTGLIGVVFLLAARYAA